MECTSHECGNPSDLYLCVQCVRDLQAWIDKVPEIRAMLFTTMAKLDNVAPKRGEGANGMSKEPVGPVRDHAMDKRYALAMWQGLDAEQLAHDQHAGGFQGMLEAMIEDAHKIVDIPDEVWAATCGCGETVTSIFDSATCESCGANTKRSTLRADKAKKVAPDLLETKDLVTWIKTYTGHDITENQIYIWASRGQITATTKNPPMYDPLGVVMAKALFGRKV